MKVKWLTLSVAGVLCLAPLAGTARAQERPAPEPETIAEGPDEGFADLDGMDEMDDLDMLLAAVVAAEAGPGGPARCSGASSGGGAERYSRSAACRRAVPARPTRCLRS
ncbi:MAG: hypothetical protein AAB113_09750, partial [Candidatus Eisenbacteria bacterium]